MNNPIKSRNRGAWHIFRWPLAIGVCSAVGLVSALVGDGFYDALSWMLLGGSVAVMLATWCPSGAKESPRGSDTSTIRK